MAKLPALDAVVVGGGPAGLAAGTWLARYRRRVVVLDSEEQRNRWVEESHGYLGRDRVRPANLLDDARADLAAYPSAELRRGVRAVDARRDGACLVVALEDGEELRAARLVLATGVADAFPEVEGFFTHYGADVFHCPTCDGFETEGLDVVALGWDAHVAGFALGLLDWARSVTVVTAGHRFGGDEREREALAANGVGLVEESAVALVGSRGAMRGVVLGSGRELACQRAFFSIAHHPRTDLADLLGCERDDEGYVRVDGENRTTVDGVYAAGDLTAGMQMVQVAAAKGAVAGVAAALSLQGEVGATTSPEPAPAPDGVRGRTVEG